MFSDECGLLYVVHVHKRLDTNLLNQAQFFKDSK